MNTVKEMLEIKGREVWSIEASRSVYQAIEMMEEMGVGALTVLDDTRLAGIVSERDFARKVILKNKSSTETSVADIMTRDVVTVGEETIISAMRKVWGRLKIVIEPSAATAVAAALEGAVDVKGKRVGIILSGGNVDLDALPWR